MTTVPKFIVTRRGAAAFILACYLVVVTVAATTLTLVEWVQSYDDVRNIDAAVIFALVMAVPFGRILWSAARPPRLPGYPKRAPCEPAPPAPSCEP